MNNKKLKICLFLGAGFSKPFGLPTMREILKEIRDKVISSSANLSNIYQLILLAKAFSNPAIWPKIKESPLGYEEINLISKKDDIESILGFLNKLESSDLDSFVYLTTNTCFALNTGHFSRHHFPLYTNSPTIRSLEDEETRKTFREKIKELKIFIKDHIVRRCWQFKVEKAIAFCRSFFDFMYNSVGNEIWVFTTNYDPIIEEYCEEESHIDLIDGFDRATRTKGIWEPEKFDKYPSARKLLKLVKLHGSCNWYEIKGKILCIPAEVRALAGGVEPKNSLIYPTQQKEIFARSPFRELFQLFQRVLLNEADGCIIIGYSFRDDIIKRIFQKALEKIQLMVIDQEASKIVENFPNKERITLVNKKLSGEELGEVQKDFISFFNKVQLNKFRQIQE